MLNRMLGSSLGWFFVRDLVRLCVVICLCIVFVFMCLLK